MLRDDGCPDKEADPTMRAARRCVVGRRRETPTALV
jgi:hypothetical protein